MAVVPPVAVKPFQSAPAITGGRSGNDAKLTILGHVSIRARHHWRAIRSIHSTGASLPQFQSAPAITGGRSPRQVGNAFALCQFQSAPAITGGRSGQSLTGIHRIACFNPRPPSLAGDPAGLSYLGQRVLVSIRARHHWRAIRPEPCTSLARIH